jgi:hypothetical protein
MGEEQSKKQFQRRHNWRNLEVVPEREDNCKKTLALAAINSDVLQTQKIQH